MPSELRVLLYSDQEVVAALAAYYRKAGKPLTIGQISRFDIIDEHDVAVDLEIETMSREVVQHFIPPKDLVAALIMQAGTAKVTLPSEAEKRIYVIENQISLVIHTRRSKAEAPRRATGQTTGNAGAPRS